VAVVVERGQQGYLTALPAALAAVVVERELVVRQAPQGKVTQVAHRVRLWAAVVAAALLPQGQPP